MFLAFTLPCMGMSDDVTAATCVAAQGEVLMKLLSSYATAERVVLFQDTRLYSLLTTPLTVAFSV
jgi:hypothetical protein